METIDNNSSDKKHKSAYLTLKSDFTTPKKSLFQNSLRNSNRSKQSNYHHNINIRSPLSFLTLDSKSTKQRKGKLIRLNSEALELKDLITSKTPSHIKAFSSFDKLKPQLPVLTTPSALNNFIIRGFKPSEESFQYIQSTRNKLKISDKFFDLKQQKIKMRTESNLEAFERIKKCTVFFSDSYAYRTNFNESNTKVIPVDKDLVEIEENNKRLLESKTKTEGKNLADMVLNLNQNENMKVVEAKADIEVSFKNLQNAIALRRIIKGKGRYNEEDDTLGISNVDKLRHERILTEYAMTKTLKQFKAPKFLKNKFGKNTVKQFRGVHGKFFGVIC